MGSNPLVEFWISVRVGKVEKIPPGCEKKSSNKLRMKELVGWNTLYQVPELINIIVFFTRIKNDRIAWA